MTESVLIEINKKLDELKFVPDSLKIVESLVKNNSSKLDNLEKRMDEKLKDMKTDFEKKFGELANKSKNNSIAIKNLYALVKEDMDAIKKSTEILVSEFPENLNMPLNDLYQKIASSIGFGDGTIPEIPTPPNALLIQIKNSKKKSSTILMRFATISDKNVFLSNYYKDAKQCNLKNLGFTEDKRLYMSHNLPPNKYKVFKRALVRKKGGVFNTVRLSDYGDIKVRVTGESKFHTIITMEDVNKFPEPANTDKNPSTSGM